ncbi:hypothetical protein [Pseudoalteromonas sp. MMG005]|uniref:hypothetical protein n=1 Tax=Pseudoalteromonas sp. MMG005 TaxID=2822682 RepID=UPI001B3A1462|nr:hypothetical protein [Pseudoalteromonas sp. MMG005]MBQ4847189.1 hypothetical protein [Pseudoalteromonas sp. MMG005]
MKLTLKTQKLKNLNNKQVSNNQTHLVAGAGENRVFNGTQGMRESCEIKCKYH